MVPSLLCQSRIAKVVVYARGALVTRRVELPQAAPAGPVDLVVPEVSPLAEPGAMRADTAGARFVLGVRPRLFVPERAVGGGELREKVREIERARARIDARLAEVQARREGLVGLSPHPALNGRGRQADPAARFGDSLAVGALADELTRTLDQELEALAREREANARVLAGAQAELAQATSRERAVPGHPSYEVTIHVAAGGPLSTVELTYPVAAARWWPAYSARIAVGAGSAELALEAFVAQASFEDWTGVTLSLCTADMASDARLPELPSMRLGRAQPPHKRGFRAPPEGMEVLFAGYDQAMRGPPSFALPQGMPMPVAAAMGGDEGEAGAAVDKLSDMEPEACEDEVTPVQEMSKKDMRRSRKAAREPSRSGGAMPPAPPMAAPASFAMAPGAPPMRPQMSMSRHAMAKGGAVGGMMRAEEPAELEESAADGYGGSPMKALPEPEPEIDADTWLDFDALALPDSAGARRGRLTRATGIDRQPLLVQASAQIESASPPGNVLDPLSTRGEFDHRFDAAGPADVPSNGLPHRVTLLAANAPIRSRFRCVPREGDEVYREAVLTNPFPSPLLGGPLEVFMDGALLATSPISPVGRGGLLTLGLGVEERLRVARNARAEESSKGVLGGTSAIDHRVDVEVASALGQDVELEILERLPVTDEKDVKVTALEAKPAGEAYDQSERGVPIRGGLCFRLKVPAGAKASLAFGYRVELPSKMEIVGGNRRE